MFFLVSSLFPERHDATDAVLSKRDFFMLFDELFSTQPKLSSNLHKRLLHIYPRLKVRSQLQYLLSSLSHTAASVSLVRLHHPTREFWQF